MLEPVLSLSPQVAAASHVTVGGLFRSVAKRFPERPATVHGARSQTYEQLNERINRVCAVLRAQGLRVGMIKHAHHSFEVDHPGKDSYELRKAGADQMLVVSRERWALMVEAPREDDPRLDEVLLDVDQGNLDLILVEGFKHYFLG